VPVLVRKIQQRFPDVRLVTRAQLVRSYRSLFDTRAGLLLGLFALVLAGFAVLVIDRAAGLSAAERRELGVLKAVGWSTAAVVRVKLIEALGTGLSGVGLGLALALSWVFWLDAPGLLAVFSGWERVRPAFALPAALDGGALFVTAALGLAVYLAAALVPAWRAAARDPDEVLR
jgi:ABC-type lipoprotein release transport system permease subunit